MRSSCFRRHDTTHHTSNTSAGHVPQHPKNYTSNTQHPHSDTSVDGRKRAPGWVWMDSIRTMPRSQARPGGSNATQKTHETLTHRHRALLLATQNCYHSQNPKTHTRDSHRYDCSLNPEMPSAPASSNPKSHHATPDVHPTHTYTS